MTLTDFEKQRQENIQRNKELLKSLNLDLVSDSIKRELPQEKPKPKRKKPAPKPSPDVSEPSRRSRRIAGVKMESTDEFKKIQDEIEQKQEKKRELDVLKQTRLYGQFDLLDLVTDSRLGRIKREEKVYQGDVNEVKDVKEEVKEEDVNEDVTQDAKEESLELSDIESDNKVLRLFRDLGDKMSAGDFYDIIRQSNLEYSDKVLEEKRQEFDTKKVYERFDPLDIKISHQRITAINFHPSVTDRIVTAGDTNGNVGIWAVDSTPKEAEEPIISILKPHGKSISKILAPISSPSKLYTSSYDGSVREMDLNKLQSSEVAYINDPEESSDYPLGVSDANICADDPNNIYFTTLSGNFYHHDLRTKFKMDASKLLRIHDKKVGGFAINPNDSNQIATASLDRTMKLWDLRSISRVKWSDFDNQTGPNSYGSYSSRLSVSCVDWNINNRLVCNGYDDNICVFDMTKALPSKNYEEIPHNIPPFTKIRHNCQTGRWVSILKAKWQLAPNDGVQKFVIANMNRALDIYDEKGQILGHLTGPNVGAVPAVSQLHPTQNWCVGGSASGKIYMFE